MEPMRGKHFERLYKPTGEIIIQWGMLDVGINYLAFSVCNALGTTPAAVHWPIMLTRRLITLETLFKNRPHIKAFWPEFKPILKDIRRHQTLRDMLSHGVAVRYDPKKDAVLFHRVDPSTKVQLKRNPAITHYPNQLLVQFSALEQAGEDCTTITADLFSLRDRVKALPRLP